MAGNIGSPLCAELNRIANNGVYPDRDDFLEEQGAANVWAGTSGLGLLGALNYIVDPNRTDDRYKGLTEVCNELAGTRGLSDVDALRTIGHPAEVLLKGTTARSASYYVDAADSQLGGGYLYLPGINANYANTPDSDALDITGDLDIQVKIALNSWTPAAANYVVTKWGAAANQRSYTFGINPNGTLVFQWSSNGTGSTTINSTAETGFAAGETKWIRIAFDVNNGASGNDIRFFTSSDGTNWTQLGTTVTSAGVASIFAGTAALEVGAFNIGTFTTSGKIYRAQILNGIDGTVAFDANFETAMTAQTVTSFTESSSNAATVTVFRTTYDFPLNTIANLGTAGSLLPTTVGSSTAADSNDAKFLDYTGTPYVYLPAHYINGSTPVNQLSVPDAVDLRITGDIDIRWNGAMDDWTPTGQGTLIAKRGNTTDIGWALFLLTTGALQLNWSANGTSALSANSTVTVPFVDGQAGWIRATLDVDNGASGNDVKFFTSTDGITWTQLGTTVTQAGVTSIFASTSAVQFGVYAIERGLLSAHKVFRAQLFSDLTETTKVLDVDTSVITTGAATSFTAVTGQTVTITRMASGRKSVAVTQPTWLFGTDDYMEVNNRYMASGTYLYMSGANSNNASAPNSVPLQITGDIDVRAKLSMDNWSTTFQTIVSKFDGSTQGYEFGTGNPAKRLSFIYSNGTAAVSATSTVSMTVNDGDTIWIRATRASATGVVKFFTSADGSTWTQLGADVSGATGNIATGTSAIGVGYRPSLNGQFSIRGKFFRAQVLNGIDGTVAFDANFETSITSLTQTSFIESSTNAATVTINRSGSTYRSAGITAAGYLYPGATNTFAASATDFLNFGAADSFTVMAIQRRWDTQAIHALIFKKLNDTAANPGYGMLSSTTNRVFGYASDGTSQPNPINSTYTSGTLHTLQLIRNVSTDTLATGTQSGTTSTTDTTTGTLSNVQTLRIGSTSTPSLYADMEFVAAAVFRNATLTTKNITDINNYFQNRD